MSADTGSPGREAGVSAKKSNESFIPIPSAAHFRRTGSLKLRNETRMQRQGESLSSATSATATCQPLRRHRSLQGLTSPTLMRRVEEGGERDEDLDSERSFGSSCNSIRGRHSPFAHNGTTYSTRKMKYVFHCSPNTSGDEYLTPTQRANRTIERLRRMLSDARIELLEKDDEIGRLAEEIVRLRPLKTGSEAADGKTKRDAAAGDESDSNELAGRNNGPRFMDVLVEERDGANAFENDNADTTKDAHVESYSGEIAAHARSIFVNDVRRNSPSPADSGNFEDIDSTRSSETEIDKLRRSYDDAREKHNEKIEQLLKIIADCNDRYYELKPKYDTAVIRVEELRKEMEKWKAAALDQRREDSRENLCPRPYPMRATANAARLSAASSAVDVEDDSAAGDRRRWPSPLPPEYSVHSEDVTDHLVNELAVTKRELENAKDTEFKNDASLSAREAISLWILGTRKAMYRALLDAGKLQRTGNEAETTLRFLKTAVFYFLTDATNSRDHLSAIESILGYSDDEKAKIEKAGAWKYYSYY